jgi:hypothetical protein
MPVQINELVIKATVSGSPGTSSNDCTTSTDTKTDITLKPIEKSVQEILEILKRKNER